MVIYEKMHVSRKNNFKKNTFKAKIKENPRKNILKFSLKLMIVFHLMASNSRKEQSGKIHLI